MHLWTEYEDNIVAGVYTVGKLQRSEGRNGFFWTEDGGAPALLRLTEALNDESELISRWKAVAAVEHPNLLAVLNSGRAVLDGVPLAWALTERPDASLADVLRERALTIEETKEVAIAVAGALRSLHAAGLIHEHVDASNVFAVGEVVKLRSDCVRPCEGDFENDTAEARQALRERDVHDFGLLLSRCLTLNVQSSADAPLPAPFSVLIPHALDATWSLDELLFRLTGVRPGTAPRPGISDAVPGIALGVPPAATFGVPPAPVTKAVAADEATPHFRTRGAVAAPPRISGRPPADATPRPTEAPLVSRRSARPQPALKLGKRMWDQMLQPKSGPYWCAAAVVVALGGIVAWNTGKPHTPAAVVKPAVTRTSPQNTPPEPFAQVVKPSAATPVDQTRSSGWHVIAYTYNYEEQAMAKALELQKRYFALQPHVISRAGHAPYFVALGNELQQQDDAVAMRTRARRAGLPRDTYIRAF